MRVNNFLINLVARDLCRIRHVKARLIYSINVSRCSNVVVRGQILVSHIQTPYTGVTCKEINSKYCHSLCLSVFCRILVGCLAFFASFVIVFNFVFHADIPSRTWCTATKVLDKTHSPGISIDK